MKPGTKVLIVGGGIAGMTCAIELGKLDADVLLIDLDPDWRVYGAGITITGPTFRALRDVGVMDEVIAQGFACTGARSRTSDGTLINEVVEIGLEPGIPFGGGILRPVLHQILADHVRQGGVTVRLGLTVAKLQDRNGWAEVTFSDGSAGAFDLVVGADGINSGIRALIIPEAAPPAFTGQSVWRVLVPRPAKLDMIEMYLGPSVKAGVTPVSARELYMFALTQEINGAILAPGDQPDRLRQALGGFGGLIAEIRETLDAQSPIVYRSLQTLLVPKPWHRGPTVLIGDAAHSTTPHLASGAGCAVKDSVVLAQELRRTSSIDDALIAFSERRFARCEDVMATSIKLGEMEMSGAPGEEQGRVYQEANFRLARAI